MDAVFTYLESYSSVLLDGWLIMQLQTAVFVLIVLAIDLSLRKASPRFRYLLWMTALVKAVIPPVLFISAADPGIAQAWYALPAISVSALASEPLSTGLSFAAVAVLLLLTSSLAFALFVLQRSVRLHWLLGNARPLKHDAWVKGPQVLVSSRIPSPLALGTIHPRIYVTEDIASSSRQALHAVLHHEHAHIERRDGLVAFLQTLVQVFYLLNPLVWLLNIRLFRYREQICDEQALERTGTRPSEYGRLLLRYAESQPARIVQTGTCFFETRRGFAARIAELFAHREDAGMKKLYRIIIVICIVLIIPLSWKCSDDAPLAEYIQSDNASYERWYGDSVQDGSPSLVVGDPIWSTVHYRKEGKLKTGHAPRIVGGLEALSKLVEYPEEAMKQGIEGTVIIKAMIVRDGPPAFVDYLNPTHPLLERAAMEAVRKADFVAARRNGKVLEAEINIPVRFRLK